MENLKKHKHIVISGDQVNALGVIRSIGEGGIDCVLIYLVESHHSPVLIRSRYVKTVHKVYSYDDAIEALVNFYGNEDCKPFVYTCDDSITSLIDEAYDRLIDRFYVFNAGSKGKIKHYMDKHVICEKAEKHGLNIPKQEIVDTGVLPSRLKYPILTKTFMSIMGRWKEDYFICHNEEELRNAYTVIQSPKLLLQEYISKKNELEVWGFSINGGEDIYIPYQKQYLRLSKESYGGYMYFTPFKDKILYDKIVKIIQECKFTGCFEVEFLVDQNDTLWFLEVNFRFAMSNYGITYGGVNYPLEWANSLINNNISKEKKLKEYFVAMNEAIDFGQSVSRKSISFIQWVKDLHSSDMLFYWNPKDPLPAWSFWWHKTVRILRKKLFKR